MSYEIKQSSTAYPLVFLMVDSSDHITAKTGLSPTVTLSKSGGSFASPSGSVSEIGSGWYKVAGNATDTGTLGPLVLHATGTGADPVDVIYRVVAHDVQDAVHLGLSCLPNVASGSSGAIPTTGTGSNQINVSGGRADANVLYWNSAAVATPDTAGYPKTTVKSGTGTGELSISSGVVSANMTQCGGSAVAAGAIPNVAAGSTGGLILIGIGTRDINPNAGGVVITTTDKQAFFDFATSLLTTSGSWGKLLVDNLDATVSSRLATASYTAPPSAATISTQVASDLQAAHGSGSWTTATGFAVAGDAMTLTSAYDAAKTAAQAGDDMGIADGAITDAKFTVPTLSTGPATGMLGKMLQLWNYFFLKRTYDGTNLKTYASDNTTVNTTQAVGESGGTQTQGKAS